MRHAGLTFRQAVWEDWEAVCALYRDASRNPYSAWDDEYPTAEFAREDIGSGNLFVLTDQGKIIGTVSIVPENEMDDIPCWSNCDGSHRELARIAVRSDRQGQGLSSLLVSSVIPILRQRGCRSIRLSVSVSNLPAFRTYQKLGFALVWEMPLYGGRYFLMEKPI